MKLHTDHHFVIGHQHGSSGMPCQDHALSGVIVPYPDAAQRAYAVVSDGCSSSGYRDGKGKFIHGHTDIGSRLITSATARAMAVSLQGESAINAETADKIFEISKIFAQGAADFLGLTKHDLLATQLFAAVDYHGECLVSIYGDGAIAFVDSEGVSSISIFAWNHNMPFYPHESRQRFIEAHGGYQSNALLHTHYRISPTGEIMTQLERTYSVEIGVQGITFRRNVLEEETALICLFTDGIMQVDKTPALDVLRSLMGFKTLPGEFVKRRLIRFLKDSRQNGLGPIDDLGLAVIVIDHETDTL